MQAERHPQGPVQPGLEAPLSAGGVRRRVIARAEQSAATIFVLPAVLVVLFLAVFPLIVSLYLSLARLRLRRGGFEIRFVGLANYRKLLLGSEHDHFVGVTGNPSLAGWLVLAVVAVLLVAGLIRYARSRDRSIGGLVWRSLAAIAVAAATWFLAQTTLSPQGRPGTLFVTVIYVLLGIFFQYLLGLGLALLVTQRLPGRRFFRVLFLLPMMITPVGVAYMWRMLTDTSVGPFAPVWQALGLANFSWVNDPWGARTAVMVGDIWQWTPFMFIVLLAALEGLSIEQVEAALVDGANRWQIFWHITWPEILPVSSTLILIRMIEGFKIVDLPNVLTNGGPGTATESLTLHAFIAWRNLDIGGSAAVAYSLLFIVTFAGISYVNLVRRRAAEV